MTERSRAIAVAGAHRTVRALAEGEGPFDGELVSRGNGVAVRVDATRLHGWAGWAFAGAEHVAAPLDVALRQDGQDALLPWCVRTVRAHLAAQGMHEGGIAHGEAVTLAVSVLRGVLELEGERESATDELRGAWWLTDEARPLFAIGAEAGGGEAGVGGAPRESGARLLRDLEARVEDRALRRVLVRLADALDDPRRLRAEASRWEQELLEIAAPRPVRMTVGESEVPVDRPQRRVAQTTPRGGDLRPRRRDLRTSAPTGGHRAAAVREYAERLVRFRTRVREHVPSPSAPSEGAVAQRRWKGPVLVAVSAAALIAVLGALWPSGTGSADAADRTPPLTAAPRPSSGAPRSRPPAPEAPPSAGAAPGTSGQERAFGASSQSDPLAAGEELIAAGRRCESQHRSGCAEVWDGGAAASRSLREANGPPVLIEDYGDIAAIRYASGEGAQMVVIIRRDAEWRIRDVYDIANPPSEGPEAP